jgi:hypothetical protein
MATTKRPTFINVMTPTGIAVYPKLNTPDTKFKAGGEFAVRLKLTAEESEPLIELYEAELAKTFEAAKAELMAGDGKSKAKAKALKLAADKPYKAEFDDEGEETGAMLFNFKMPNRIAREGKPDLVLFPDVFDSKGKQLKDVPEIWGGSKLKVSGQLRPFNTAIGVGLSLRLQAVQIIQLNTRGSRDAAGYGFGAEDGGYEGADAAPESSSFGDESGAGDSTPAGDNTDF